VIALLALVRPGLLQALDDEVDEVEEEPPVVPDAAVAQAAG
jgi:hypothetical protein